MLLYSGPHTSLREGRGERKIEKGEERGRKGKKATQIRISAFPFVVTSRITYRSSGSCLLVFGSILFPCPF